MNRKNSENNRANMNKKIQSRHDTKMKNLMKEIQIFTLIQGKELPKRLDELSIMLKQNHGNSEYVANELQELSVKLLKLADD